MADVLDCISHQLSAHHFAPFVFVQHYTFSTDQTQEMMQTSFRHIKECDLFIAELTHKVVGVGIEAGYATAHNKPIVYIRHATASPSTTMTGIADYHITYTDVDNLSMALDAILKQL